MLIDRLTRLLDASDARVLVGITGAPGAGKSTLAERLLAGLAGRGIPAALVPMDGFHLAQVELSRRGIADRKGAIDTFDADGYLALLRRLRTERGTVLAPLFDRALEEPIAGAVPVGPEVRCVLTEGNYLLAETPPWPAVRAELDEVWYLDPPADVRRERLVARHVAYGRSPAEAEAWVGSVDDVNAALIAATRDRADHVVTY